VQLQWIPVPAIHYGDPVGDDSLPCRRKTEPASTP
jgi:hypothetical protein